MEWIIVGVLLILAFKTESLQDIVTGGIGLILVMALCVGLFWAAVIFPIVAIAIFVLLALVVVPYLLQRLTLSDERIQRTITKRRRELGYDK